jgi:phage tail-like protein
VSDTNWSQPKFAFSVEIPELGVVAFQEVSGLDIEASLIQYRKANPRLPRTIKLPGIQATSGIVTMKRGVFVKDNRFWDWHKSITNNQARRTTVTIKLIDERGQPAMTWTLANALPTKITGADLNAAGNDVAVETLEISHEQITVSNN